MNISNVFKKMLGSSKMEQKLNKVKILDFKVVSHKTNPLHFWELPECEMTFVAKNGKTYTAYGEFSELSMCLEINIRGLVTKDNRLIANIDETDFGEFSVKYERIDVQNDLNGIGIGNALQEMMNRTFFLMTEENDIKLIRIHGVIGINGYDTPERSMTLYKSFDQKMYNNHKLVLNTEGFDTANCNLEYFIE